MKNFQQTFASLSYFRRSIVQNLILGVYVCPSHQGWCWPQSPRVVFVLITQGGVVPKYTWLCLSWLSRVMLVLIAQGGVVPRCPGWCQSQLPRVVLFQLTWVVFQLPRVVLFLGAQGGLGSLRQFVLFLPLDLLLPLLLPLSRCLLHKCVINVYVNYSRKFTFHIFAIMKQIVIFF